MNTYTRSKQHIASQHNTGLFIGVVALDSDPFTSGHPDQSYQPQKALPNG